MKMSSPGSRRLRALRRYEERSEEGPKGPRQQAPISVLRRAISRRKAPFSATFVTLLFLRFVSRSRAQSPFRVPHLVGSRLPSPYHFRARNQSFQAVAAPFPGDSVRLPSGPLALRSGRPKRLGSGDDERLGDLRRDGRAGTNIEQLRNSGKKFVEWLGTQLRQIRFPFTSL